MSTKGQATMLDRFAAAVPRSYRTEMSRFARRLKARMPPVQIEHRIETLERHLERQLKSVEAKLDEVLRRLDSPGR